MDPSQLKGKTAVVTGAGSGIGRATAVALARNGADLFVCDVDRAGLDATAESIAILDRRVQTTVVDVADRKQMEGFAAQVHEEVAGIDLLVNNAGIAVSGSFVDVPFDEWDRILAINLRGVVLGCHLFVPRMLERGAGGHVVNIASMAGYTPGPGMTAYTATKFGVLGFSECLRAELASAEIGVSAICPGIIDTAIVRSGRYYGTAGEEQAREEASRIFSRRNYSPERVAEGILRAIRKNRAVAPISPEAWTVYYLRRLVPGLFNWLARHAGERAQARLGAQAGR